MSQALHEAIIGLSNHFGSDAAYARAGGGNASVKHDGILHIKPSGTTLAALRDEDLVPLRIAPLLEALGGGDDAPGDPVMAAAEAARVGEPGGRRPSVEILFHALIPDALVLHLHPVRANAITCNTEGRRLTAELLGDEAVWVDYIDPGVPLARGIAATRAEFEQRTGTPAPAITMMGNHGIIVSGNSYEDVAGSIELLDRALDRALGATPPEAGGGMEVPDGTLEALAQGFSLATDKPSVSWRADDFIRANATQEAGPVSAGPTIPDQIVYAGSFPLLLIPGDDAEAVADKVQGFAAQHGRPPVVAVVPGAAVLAVGDSDKQAVNALETFLDALAVARDANRLGAYRAMDERERHFIEHWEAEAYRRAVAADD